MAELIRVVEIIHNLGLGGAERQLFELVSRLPRERFQVSIITFVQGGNYESRLLSLGVEIHTIPKRSPVDIACLMRLRSKLRQLAPQVVHCWMFTAGLWGALALMRMRPRPGLLIAERNAYPNAGTLRRLAYRLQAGQADRVLGNSQAVAGFWRRCGASPGKLVVIENGMDFERFDHAKSTLDRAVVLQTEGLDPTLPLVLSIGRFVEQKDQGVFIEAASLLMQRGVLAQFAIVGDGPLEDALRQSIHEKGLEGRFHLLHSRPSIEPLLLSASVFCLPSLHEGFPNALAEALGCGLPCIATRVSGSVDLIEDGVTGRLMACGDAAELADALAGYLADPHTARLHGAAARDRVHNQYSVERMVQRYSELYGALATGKKGQ